MWMLRNFFSLNNLQIRSDTVALVRKQVRYLFVHDIYMRRSWLYDKLRWLGAFMRNALHMQVCGALSISH